MKTLLQIFATALFLTLSFNTVAYETETSNTINLESEWVDTDSVEELQRRPSGGLGVSCSSKDGTVDCFCDGGCRRTEDSCDCTINVRTNDGLLEMLE